MRNKNMMMMGIVMVICQAMVLGVFGLFFAYDYGTTIMMSTDSAAKIVAATFFGLVNILSFGLIVYGASD